MANVVVDSGVMRDKATTIETAATKIQELYADMLQDVTSTASKMKGTTIETQKEKFAGMQQTFDTFVSDMKNYSKFLSEAADSYDAADAEVLSEAQEQGKIF